MGTYLSSLSGHNVSELTNDVNYQTKSNTDALYQSKGSYLTSISGLNISDLTNDSNYQTNTTGLTVFQAKGTYLSSLSGVNLSTGTNDSNWQGNSSSTGGSQFLPRTGGVISGDVNSVNLHADTNITIGTNGYITISGTTMIIGMN